MHTVTRREVRALFPNRPAWSHKGQAGKLLLVGGSFRYSGSPAIAALAAIRAGTDLTLVAAPRRAADIIAGFQPDLITEPMHCEHLCPKDVDHIGELMEWADAVVIGGGLDRQEKTYDAIRQLLRNSKKPCVLDAEALRAVAGRPELLNRTFLLTPHEDEFRALGGEAPSHVIGKRIEQVKSLSSQLNVTILLKGSIDIISDGGKSAANKTGNPYMTKGGTGDILAGVCGALMSRGIEPFKAGCAAAWINGATGDVAVKRIGPGFLVSEMVDFIPGVIWD
jgi:NAD(P)H-hydrate epimerase